MLAGLFFLFFPCMCLCSTTKPINNKIFFCSIRQKELAYPTNKKKILKCQWNKSKEKEKRQCGAQGLSGHLNSIHPFSFFYYSFIPSSFTFIVRHRQRPAFFLSWWLSYPSRRNAHTLAKASTQSAFNFFFGSSYSALYTQFVCVFIYRRADNTSRDTLSSVSSSRVL